MNVLTKFLRALKIEPGSGASAVAGLARMAAAAVAAIPQAAGAVLCIHDDQRDPSARTVVSVSDAQALLAEQLEYTVGAGPGLAVLRTGSAVRGGLDLSSRWPAFADALAQNTTLVAVYAAPVFPGHYLTQATLLLYCESVDDLEGVDDVDVGNIAAVIAGAVAFAEVELAGGVWEPSPGAVREALDQRHNIDIAVGIVAATLDLSVCDAKAVLRSYAWSRGLALEPLSRQLVSRELPGEALR